MEKQLAVERQKVDAQVKKIDSELTQLSRQIIELNEPFQILRSEITSLTYKIEVAGSESRKNSLRKDIDEIRKRQATASITQPDESTKRIDTNYAQMEKDLNDWKARKAQLQQQRVELLKPSTELEASMNKYLTDRMPDVNASTITGIQNRLARWDTRIKQIHVKDVDLVDRCESCHLGIREPIALTKAAMGGEAAFTSHPNKDLFRIHDPERFGCTPCHNGNGTATSSVTKGHGRHKYWLWPMYYRENFEAGCQQCHAKEVVTDFAPVLNEGREIFRRRGCMGCHRYEGFDRDPEDLSNIRQQLRQLDTQRAELEREAGFTIQKADRSRDNAEAQRLYTHADDLKVRSSAVAAKMEQLSMRAKSLQFEVKKVGPNLKEAKMKLRKEWIPVWIKDPNHWRPGAKMPTFRLADEEVRAISAFIWQSSVSGKLTEHAQGDPVRGKESFETRGCMGCHSMGEGNQREGGDFAANLTRIGEKTNHNYLVRWIQNPRERTAPYSPSERRDLTEEDYKKAGVPFVFDRAHSRSPIDGSELVVENMTVMPDLRLSVEETRDIASYLMSQKRDNAQYPNADYMDDPKLKARGQFLVRHYGCAGCHEIAGLEEEQRIGTELTKEGSKPIERLDFALLGHQAQNEGWYTHKGFFEHKLENPAVYDQGKEKTDPLERLKMPNFNLTKHERDAVATFLLGSVDSFLPPRYHFNPSDQRQDVIEGWWVVRKYNCMGCHQLMEGQTTSFQKIKRYDDPDWKEQRPPSLRGEGARVSPIWLREFLNNPAMQTTTLDRNGVRTYLKARMPTFYFSEGELRKLVRFFEALSSQAQPYIEQKVEAPTEQEKQMARALFSSEGAPCLKCHATGDAAHDARATAPNFTLIKERLKPGWTRRWILDPAMIMPGTAMPSGLFTREGDHFIFAGPLPESFKGYNKDHADLLVRYMFHFTPDEVSRLRTQ
jgi:cbb3-type cytochrome oxidase cytochrome c subunit